MLRVCTSASHAPASRQGGAARRTLCLLPPHAVGFGELAGQEVVQLGADLHQGETALRVYQIALEEGP